MIALLAYRQNVAGISNLYSADASARILPLAVFLLAMARPAINDIVETTTMTTRTTTMAPARDTPRRPNISSELGSPPSVTSVGPTVGTTTSLVSSSKPSPVSTSGSSRRARNFCNDGGAVSASAIANGYNVEQLHSWKISSIRRRKLLYLFEPLA
mmetsp:Transcript_17775/g.41407  ORF Transcript_17775/g.41407 Transcript_17775/m.41407 type:complete len:156 (-) Transcript_17775:7-474(-)